jgi:hypothetical protein
VEGSSRKRNYTNVDSLRRRAHLKTGHRLNVVDILILIAHVLKSYKSSTNSINLKLDYKGRSASHLSYLYLNRVFKQDLMKLYAFQNGVLMKNFGVPSPSSGMAGFQMRPPSYKCLCEKFSMISYLKISVPEVVDAILGPPHNIIFQYFAS